MDFKVRYNHVGYAPNSPKVFLLAADSTLASVKGVMPAFDIVSENGFVMYSGQMSEKTVCSYTDEWVWKGDFSALKMKGKFTIRVNDSGKILAETHSFEIAENILPDLLFLTLKSFYFQRSGVELPADKAGKWARPKAHLDDCIEFHPSMNRKGTWNAHGGWYDAGDYGKYIVNGGVSVATLLLVAEFTEKRNADLGENSLANNSFSLPLFRENLLDEIRFELEFFLRMQDTDGGVFFKVSPIRWDGFVTPTESDEAQKRQILGKSTTSTLNFAGALAEAHRVFKNVDSTFAEQCLTAAIRAYIWALKNPDVTYPHNTEGSGGYGDERYDDEFFWARAMLFREICKGVKSENVLNSSLNNLRDLILVDMKKCPPSLGLDWRDTQNLGWIALALQSYDLDLQTKARNALKTVADDIVRLASEDAYHLAIRRFVWGSNGDVANHALTLFLVNSWAPSLVYVNCAKTMLDFIFGKNPVDRCFVTGSAWSSPKFLHHRISHSDGIDEPVPGLVAGGINADRQDLHRFPHYPGPQPGFSYTDERVSFASNETAINWNAPLVAALYFESCC